MHSCGKWANGPPGLGRSVQSGGSAGHEGNYSKPHNSAAQYQNQQPQQQHPAPIIRQSVGPTDANQDLDSLSMSIAESSSTIQEGLASWAREGLHGTMTDLRQTINEVKRSEVGATSMSGMKKWLAEYHAKRPGLSVLQAEVDAFMADYDAREEKARKDKIVAVEEDGWTVVIGSKGRQKTTDSESGIRVGAVSTTAMTENATKRSKKEVVLDFYQFQKRESKRNEVLELQQKFLEDKKRIAKMREARKFRPF